VITCAPLEEPRPNETRSLGPSSEGRVLQAFKTIWEHASDSRVNTGQASTAEKAAVLSKVEYLQESSHLFHDIEIGLDIVVRATQQATGATGAALALVTDGRLICRGRVGDVAPSVGVVLDGTAGLTAMCVRRGEALHCSDAESDSRVDQALCRELNVRSILVVPMIEEKTVVGVLEVLSSEANAFNASHVQWLSQAANFAQKIAGSMRSSPPDPLTVLNRAESVLPIGKGAAENGDSKHRAGSSDLQVGQRETDLALISTVLQDETANWREIWQRLESRSV
jgi:GAF domain